MLFRSEGLLCFNDTATTEIYTLSLHDALPIFTMLNNNSGKYAKRANNNSYYYQFKVNESAKNYRVTAKKAFEKTSDYGNIIKDKNLYIYCCSSKNKFMETDATGKIIKSFKTSDGAYRVYKNDWKNFWFY